MKFLIYLLVFFQCIYSSVFGQNLNWLRQTGGIQSDNTIGMAVDNELNIYAVSNFVGNIVLTTGQNFSSFGKEDFLVKKFAPNGVLQWARKFGGRESDFVSNITTDNANNTYVTGTFQDTLKVFDQLLLTSPVNTTNVGFILKISPIGDVLWAKALQPTIGSYPVKARALSGGDVIVVGNFEGTADFDPGPGQQNITSTGLFDMFFLRLTSEGSFVWVRKIGGTENEFINDMVIDNVGNIVTVGQFNQVVDFDPGSGQFFTPHNGGSDIFIHKLSPSGDFILVASAGGGGFDAALAVDIAPNNDIVSVGRFSNTVDFNPALNQSINLTSEGSWDGFILKLNASGEFVWVKKIGGSQNDQSVSVDVSSNNLIAVGGIYRGTVNFNPNLFPNQFSTSLGGADNYHLLLNGDGSYNSHFSIGGVGNEHINKILIYSLNNILSAGNFVNIVDFDPSQVSANFTSTGNTDGYLSNTFICVKPFIPEVVTNNDLVCRGEMFTITLPGAVLNGANQWSWYQTSCNTTSFATGNSISGTIIQNTIFYVRGTGGCVQNSDCRDILISAFTDTLTNQAITLCQGESITVGTHVYNTTGLYRDTLIASAGCDSIVFTNLNVVAPSFREQAFTICPGEEIIVGSSIYRNNGLYMDTLTNVNGCDSIISTSITVIPIEIITQNINLCQGETFTVEDSVYTETGVYVNSIITPDGCENFIITNLTVYPLEFNITHNLCFGDTLRIGNQFYTNSLIVVEFLGSSIGCDSIVNHTINFFDNTLESQNVFLCEGDSLIVGNNIYYESGLFSDSLVNIAGCDSIILSNIVFFDKPEDKILNFKICEGQSILVNGETYFVPGTYRDSIQTETGCDSIVVINLVVYPTFTQNFYTICQGDSILFGNQYLKQQGVYSKIFTSSLGCDSTSAIVLTVIPKVEEFEFVQICQNETYSIGNSTYSSSGIYVDTLVSSRGCDSIVETTLQVKPARYQRTAQICQGQQIQIGGSIYTMSGTYVDSLMSVTGCDSIITTTLIVNPVDFRVQNLVICSGKSITVGTTTYNKSGIYTNTFKNQYGCDSIVETRLTVTPVPTINKEAFICPGSTITIGNFTFSLPGIYDVFISNTGSCDTLIKLDLKIVSGNIQVSRVADTLIAVQQANTTYQWYTCDAGMPKVLVSNSRKFLPQNNGRYELRITVLGCTFTGECIDYIKSNTVEVEDRELKIYPNPTTNEFLILWKGNNISEYILRNSKGERIFSGSISGGLHTVYWEDQPPGIYFLTLFTKEGLYSVPVIKL